MKKKIKIFRLHICVQKLLKLVCSDNWIGSVLCNFSFEWSTLGIPPWNSAQLLINVLHRACAVFKSCDICNVSTQWVFPLSNQFYWLRSILGAYVSLALSEIVQNTHCYQSIVCNVGKSVLAKEYMGIGSVSWMRSESIWDQKDILRKVVIQKTMRYLSARFRNENHFLYGVEYARP